LYSADDASPWPAPSVRRAAPRHVSLGDSGFGTPQLWMYIRVKLSEERSSAESLYAFHTFITLYQIVPRREVRSENGVSALPLKRLTVWEL